MNKQETKKILMLISGAYPNMKITDKETMIEVWFNVLNDIPYEQVSKALYKFMRGDVSGFPPSVGQIVNLCREEVSPTLDESTAWNYVRKALSNSNYNAESEFDKLPELVQRAVGSPNQLRVWAGDEEFNDGVESSNFKRAYRTMCERKRYDLEGPFIAIGNNGVKDMQKLIQSVVNSVQA